MWGLAVLHPRPACVRTTQKMPLQSPPDAELGAGRLAGPQHRDMPKTAVSVAVAADDMRSALVEVPSLGFAV